MTAATSAQFKSAVRPPVVVVVGHIDHGKSTLLDYIRKSNVVATEAGGITQHTSAYEVIHPTEDGTERKLTFLDTPGHEAFAEMRARGASVSDVAILVVSAEDGVKPQTLEALAAVKAAGIPFVVAINKIDRPNANPDRVKQELGEHEVYVESYGGKVPSVNISAKTGEGISDLLDLILLVADLENLTGIISEPADGYVLESYLDPKVGITITLIIKNGTLLLGDLVVIEDKMAKIKKIENFLGNSIKSASLSAPVKIYGFTDPVEVGQDFKAFGNKKEAEKYVKDHADKKEVTDAKSPVAATLGSESVELAMVIKSDSHGTLEAVMHEVCKLASDRVRFKIVDTGIGTITDRDLKLLIGSSHPLVAGFNVRADRSASDLAERYNVPLQTFDIIYKLTEWLEEQLKLNRPELTEEVVMGQVKILKVFSQNNTKQVVGGQVQTGRFKKGASVKILRREAEIGRGKVVELQAQKVAVAEVLEGDQFGTMIDAKIQLSAGDVLQAVEMVTQ